MSSDHIKSVRKEKGLTNWGRFWVLFSITIWIVLFAAGLIVNSEPFRVRISNPLTPPSVEPSQMENMLLVWIIAILCYTPTNIILLSILTGLLGALGRCATLHDVTTARNEQDEKIPLDPFNPYLSGVIRGLFTYLLIISGMIIAFQQPFAAPTPDQYVRLAGITSLASFVVSYNPRHFRRFFLRAKDIITDKKKSDG